MVQLAGAPFHDLFELGDSFILPGVNNHHGDTQLPFQPFHIDLDAFFPSEVHHGQRHHHGYFEIDDLRAEKEVSFEVAGIYEQDDHVRADGGVLVEEDLIGHPFVGPFGIEAVRSRQVDDRRVDIRGEVGGAAFFVYSDAGKIAYFLVQAGKGIEEGAFPAVGIADEGNMDVVLLQIYGPAGMPAEEGKGRGEWGYSAYEMRNLGA